MHDFGMMGMMGIMALTAVFFFWLVGVAAFVFWLWVLIDILKSEFTGSNKIVWLLAVILLPLLGAVLYWFIGREQKVGDEERERPIE
jgi:Phospholipase_D-nuclease N-terminal